MTLVELEAALDRWGPDLATWPPQEAARARRTLAGDPQARRTVDAALTVQHGLAALRAHRAPANLAARIVAEAATPDRLERLLGWLTRSVWRPAMLALALAVGGYLAGAAVSEPVDPTLADDVMSLAFMDLYAELDDAQ